MSCKISDGKKISEKFLMQTKKYISEHKITPRLATILVGHDTASETYISIKKKTCESVGIHVDTYNMNPKSDQIKELIQKLNDNIEINGVLVQLPLPENIQTQEIIETIRPEKDVDGIHPVNLGRLAYGDETIPACTAM